MELHKKFKQIRQQRGWTLADLAKVAGSVASISDFENGKTRLAYETLFPLLDVLLVAYQDFFTWQEVWDPELNELTREAQNAIDTQNIEKLAVLADLCQKRAMRTRQTMYQLLAYNFFILRAELLGQEPDQKMLAWLHGYFLGIEVWTSFDVSMLGNVASHLLTACLELCAQEIASDLSQPVQGGKDRLRLDTLLNIAGTFLDRREQEGVKKLMNALNRTIQGYYFTFHRLRYLEVAAAYESLWGQASVGLSQHEQVLAAVTLFWGEAEAKRWAAAYQQTLKGK